MSEKVFKYNGDVWTIKQFKNGQVILRCIAVSVKDPDFPVSEVRFDFNQLIINDKIDENPVVNAEKGRKITMYHATNGVQMLKLLTEIVEEGERID
jgi:hypothetical protein